MSKRGWLAVLVLLALASAGAFYLRAEMLAEHGPPTRAAAGETALYQCAMHPQITSSEPGLCPICGMKLQRVDDAAEHAHDAEKAGATKPASTGERAPSFYRHPMRADVTSPVPAKDEMGMDYIPVYEEEAPTAAGPVPGHAPFTLSTERQQLIGVTRGVVETRPLEAEIRAVGRVAYDPMLYQAVVEYREALRSRARMQGSSLPEAHRSSDAVLRGARLKLRQQGLSDAQIERLASSQRDPIELLLPGDSVWVYAQVYEYEIGLVEPGQTMEITAPSQPGKVFKTKVAAVDSILDPTTRTVRVRGLVPTPGEVLRPESFVDVKIHVPLGERLSIPVDAVLDTGEHRVVFVVKGEGRFEPRSVELGREAQGYYEVLAGLAPGDEVVTSANFLIDSESRFRAALAAHHAPAADKITR